MKLLGFAAAGLVLVSGAAWAQDDAAKKFGAREGVEGVSLSPDGTRVVFLQPGPGASTVAFVAEVAGGAAPKPVFRTDGNPEAVRSCRWASAARIVCNVSFTQNQAAGLVGYTRMVAVNPDGSNPKLLSAPVTNRALGVAQAGGEVIDWLSDKDGEVLMTRVFVPETDIGTHIAETRQGYGVERVDTMTLKRSAVEQPRKNAVEYIADGHGTVRVMATTGETGAGYATGVYRYFYRKPGSRDWESLSTWDSTTDTGFLPIAVDRDLNTVYGFDKQNGRQALFRIALDGTLARTLVFQHPEVDIDDLIRIGRQQRVVGLSYATDKREAMFFDPAVKAIAASLSKALPGLPLVRIVDASADENRVLLFAGSDVDPGRYYVFDRKAKQLMEIMLARPDLEHVKLAVVKPVRFKAADGTDIPGYLTLPPGSDGKGLPAIVMPHGGPSARDEWGFDWLAQYFAARGYAVLQPNFRGSAGYGEDWFVENGFRSWKTAIGDVNDGARWLVKEGIAAPGRLAILGWSYGGYAALQSGVLDPGLFKAIVAVAPVTDLLTLKTDASGFTSARLVRDFIGSGPHVEEGSPARNAGAIRVPVLMFHGDKDANVDIGHARLMAERLKAAGKKVELVQFPGLDHQLQDGAARAQLLERSDAFLREAFK